MAIVITTGSLLWCLLVILSSRVHCSHDMRDTQYRYAFTLMPSNSKTQLPTLNLTVQSKVTGLATSISYAILINSKVLANCSLSFVTVSTQSCLIRVPQEIAGRGDRELLSVALYERFEDEHTVVKLRLLQVVERDLIDIAPKSTPTVPPDSTTVATTATWIITRPRVFIYNTVEATPQSQSAMAFVNKTGTLLPTVENLVQSDDAITCSSQHGNCGVYHATPVLSQNQPAYYCWWRRRNSTDVCPWLPQPCQDCPNITANAEYLAKLWQRTGIDVVVPDTTNLRQETDTGADELNFRPVEVLAEELIALRAAGTPTPQFAVWTVAALNTSMYKGMLRVVLNNPAISTADLYLRSPTTGKLIYFVHGDAPAPPDAATVASIEANSGGNNVSVINMWANLSPQQTASGTWTFFQPCQRTSEPMDWTNTVLNDAYYQCNHLLSSGSNGGLGTQMSLAMSWQSADTSLSWGTPSKLMGLTFQVMVDDALRAKPQNVMLPSFDEWGAGFRPIDDKYKLSQYTVGFPPTEQHVAFLDTFGAERSRSWAPTVEAGDFYLQLTTSCLRVIALAANSGATTCDVVSELCCNRTFSQFTRVFSLKTTTNATTALHDYLVTSEEEEAHRLQQQGQYTQICASSLGSYSTDYFCYTPGEITFETRMGPFILYTLPTAPPPGFASLLHMGPRTPVYRCRRTNIPGNHFMSTKIDCGGSGTVMESLLGYASVKPHTGMPRKLRTCSPPSATLVQYHTLDAFCLNNDVETLIGHVL